MRTVRLRVELRDVLPRVVRVLDVPAAVTLPELHDLLQVAVGWTDSHLHQFVVYMRDFGEGFDVDALLGLREVDETGVRLRDLPEAHWPVASGGPPFGSVQRHRGLRGVTTLDRDECDIVGQFPAGPVP